VIERAATSLPEIEKATLRVVALRVSANNEAQAARLLGMAPISLICWLKRRSQPESGQCGEADSTPIFRIPAGVDHRLPRFHARDKFAQWAENPVSGEQGTIATSSITDQVDPSQAQALPATSPAARRAGPRSLATIARPR